MGHGTLIFPFFALYLSFLWFTKEMEFSVPKVQVSTELRGESVIEKPMEIRFRISHFYLVDQIELILSSEEFHEVHLNQNLFLPENEKANFRLLPFHRTKELCRTRQSFQLKRVSPSQVLEGWIHYRSPLPGAALNYPVELKLWNGSKLIATQTVKLSASPANTVFVHCDWIKSNTSPQVRCTGIDQRGNQTREPLEIRGSFHPDKSGEIYNFTESLELIPPSKPAPYSRFYYQFQEQRFQSSALPNPRTPIVFGDLHTHSMYSDSRVPATPAELVNYARSVALLDFVAITDHSEGVFGEPLSIEEFQETAKTLRKLNSPGVFTTFLGFEWTSTFHNENSPFGHRTVIYPGLRGYPYRSDQEETNTPEKLYEKTGPVFSFPHHTMIPWGAFRFDQKPVPFYEKGVEIYSAHGSSEEMTPAGRMKKQISAGAIREAVKKRYPFRILAASDTHAAHPGLNNWPGVKPGMLDAGGLTAVFSRANSRRAIFDGLWQQKFYATSGTKILIEPSSWKHLFPLQIHGTNQLKKAEIYEFLEGESPRVSHVSLSGLSAKIEHQVHPQTYGYYVRITQMDEERAWIGPVYRLPAIKKRTVN